MRHWDHRRILKGFLTFGWVLSALIAIAGASEVIAKEYFVAASNGNDANPGTIAAPFSTLKKGVSVLLPGDTLFVRQGTYLGSSSLSKIPNGKSWAEPVSIKAYQEEKVVIAAEPGVTVLTFKPGNHHIIFDGFIFDATGGHGGIRTGEGSHHIRIINGEVMNAPSQGILTQVGTAGASESFEFINLRIHDNGSDDFDHGIYITTNNHLVKDCLIYRNAGWGVHIWGGSNYKPSNNKIVNNKIYNNRRAGQRGPGIGIYNGHGNVAYNNLIWGNRFGIHVDYGASNSKVYNNTIFGASEFGIILGDSSSGTHVWNNIISSSSSTGLLIARSSKNSQIKNNLVYGNGGDLLNRSDTTVLSDNLVGNTFNPRFQDPAKLDFRLKDGSPAHTAGLVINEVTVDFDYNSRSPSAKYCIGAYQNKNALGRPTSLKVLKP